MNDQYSKNKIEDSQSEDAIERKARRRMWVLAILVVVVIIVGYQLISNWENFSRGISGKPETTNS